jgi:hypothetical protein
VIRSTLFFVDKGEDTGPVLAQSKPLNILHTISELENKAEKGLLEGLSKVMIFVKTHNIEDYEDFAQRAGAELLGIMGKICNNLQDTLKVVGDWRIYPFAVHDLIASGRVQIADRIIYIDGREIPKYGYRMDE